MVWNVGGHQQGVGRKTGKVNKMQLARMEEQALAIEYPEEWQIYSKNVPA
jgi:hypothetical protein